MHWREKIRVDDEAGNGPLSTGCEEDKDILQLAIGYSYMLIGFAGLQYIFTTPTYPQKNFGPAGRRILGTNPSKLAFFDLNDFQNEWNTLGTLSVISDQAEPIGFFHIGHSFIIN